jgi:hypothetical protein
MGTLVQHKRQIIVLEVECNMLHNMVINFMRETNPGPRIRCNCKCKLRRTKGRRDSAISVVEDMEIAKLESYPIIATMEEATSRHAFC